MNTCLKNPIAQLREWRMQSTFSAVRAFIGQLAGLLGIRADISADLLGLANEPKRIARVSLNFAAPVLKGRFAPSRRNCMASHAPIGGGAALRIKALSSLASQYG